LPRFFQESAHRAKTVGLIAKIAVTPVGSAQQRRRLRSARNTLRSIALAVICMKKTGRPKMPCEFLLES
jgi:hypothetical protein